jgi:hypothetical protein
MSATRFCISCGRAPAHSEKLCHSCYSNEVLTQCRTIGCTKKRAPGHQFCNDCLDASSPEELKEALYEAFLRGMKVPNAAYKRMCPEAQAEFAKEFCDRLTISYAGEGKPHINWSAVRRSARRIGYRALEWAMLVVIVILVWIVAVFAIGYSPNNVGTLFGRGY